MKTKELKSEIEFVLPFENDVIRGVIDLLIIHDDRIEIIDYKTDSSLNNIEKYKIQLAIYKEVIKNIYPDKKIECKLFFVSLDKLLEIEPPNFEDIYKVNKS
jgi:ATP-dependent helicase/nuclease subunit A